MKKRGNDVMFEETSNGDLASTIKRIYESDPSQSEFLIEAYLGERWKAYPTKSKTRMLEELAEEFGESSDSGSGLGQIEEDILLKLFDLLLGKRVSRSDLSSKELLQKLAQSLNTIFDSLNRLVGAIKTTLFPGATGDETIRRVIGSSLEGKKETVTLESYLGQISQAFSISQEAFKNAAHSTVNKILQELDPGRIQSRDQGRFKITLFSKSRYFDEYERKFVECKKWFDSERFMNEFLREFEHHCRMLSKR
jgi:hypothetical protein